MRRFHLSTLLLLTVLAGAFVGAQFWTRHNEYRFSINGGDWVDCNLLEQGFPFRCRFDSKIVDGDDWYFEFDWVALALNCTVGLSGLALAGYVSEKIIRRKESV